MCLVARLVFGDFFSVTELRYVGLLLEATLESKMQITSVNDFFFKLGGRRRRHMFGPVSEGGALSLSASGDSVNHI